MRHTPFFPHPAMNVPSGSAMPWHPGQPGQPVASSFDPEAVAALLDAQWPGLPEVAAALRRCTTQWVVDEQRTCLVDPDSDEMRLDYKAVLVVQCPRYGSIRLEVLENGRILDLDHLDGEMPTYGRSTEPELPAYVPPFTVVHRSWDKAPR